MKIYLVGEEVRFVRQVTRKDLEREIDMSERGRIVAVAMNGKYTVKLHADDLLVSEIFGVDIMPVNEW